MALTKGIHGVVVVHGIGDQKKGDTVAEFSKALCDSLINSPKGNTVPNILLTSDISSVIPSVTLNITSPYGEQSTWICKEAYWNDSFPPPKSTQVLWWGLTQNLIIQVKSLLAIFTDPDNKKLPTDFENQKEEKKPANAKTPAIDMGSNTKIGIGAKSSVLSGVFLLIITLPVYLILALIYFLGLIPQIETLGALNQVIKWVRKLDPFLSNSLGDVQRYVEHQVWSANARARIETIVISMLNDEEVKDITIVAHSMGAVVAYDSLTEGGNIARAITNSKAGISKKITLVTAGGAINRVFDIVSPPKNKKKKEIRYNDLQISKPLARAITGYGDEMYHGKLEDKFYWLDIFARKDPVPAGPVTPDIIKNKVKIDPLQQLKERQTINKDSLIFDHTSYWDNQELVIPRITRAINGGKEDVWPEAGITEAKITARIKKALRFGRLTNAILVLAVIAGIIMAILKLTGTI